MMRAAGEIKPCAPGTHAVVVEQKSYGVVQPTPGCPASLPGETFYSAALEKRSEIVEDALGLG